MAIWLGLIPRSVVNALNPFIMLSIGFLVEKYFTSRVTMFSNTYALVTFFAGCSNLPQIVDTYVFCGLMIGVIAFLDYLQVTKAAAVVAPPILGLSKLGVEVGNVLYNSKVAGLFLLAGVINHSVWCP